MVTHETPGDTFWDKIRAGRAGRGQEGQRHPEVLERSGRREAGHPDPERGDSKVDGIATTLATPDALKPAVQAAVAAKIPVVAFNSGINQYQARRRAGVLRLG